MCVEDDGYRYCCELGLATAYGGIYLSWVNLVLALVFFFLHLCSRKVVLCKISVIVRLVGIEEFALLSDLLYKGMLIILRKILYME